MKLHREEVFFFHTMQGLVHEENILACFTSCILSLYFANAHFFVGGSLSYLTFSTISKIK